MTPSPTLHEGRNLPSPVSRLLAFGFHDGATDGVLQVGESGELYRFALVGEEPREDDADVRLFELSPLPADALDALTSLLAPYMKPVWPYWVPLWSFPSPADQAAVEARVDEVLRHAGPVAWRVEADDLMGILYSVVRVTPEATGSNGSPQKEGTHASRSDQR